MAFDTSWLDLAVSRGPGTPHAEPEAFKDAEAEAQTNRQSR